MRSDLVYKCNGPHKGPFGTTYDFKAVYSQMEELQAIDEGWSISLIEAVMKFKGIKEPEVELDPIENVNLPIEVTPEPEGSVELPIEVKAKPKRAKQKSK